MSIPIPVPLFGGQTDLLGRIPDTVKTYLSFIQLDELEEEYDWAVQFLMLYSEGNDTFVSYRRELERLCQWSWVIHNKPFRLLQQQDIILYLNFLRKPPKQWIGIQQATRFIQTHQGLRPNPQWRPFWVRVHKRAHREGVTPSVAQYRLGPAGFRAVFAILGSFFSYLQEQGHMQHNPVRQIRQKKQWIRTEQQHRVTRKLTHLQWDWIIRCIHQKATDDSTYERHLFLISVLYLLGLRISEVSETKGRVPTMGDFVRDQAGLWWFQTVGKGNKFREIAVPDDLLHALKRYRLSLGLSALPYRGDQSPLLPKMRGYGGLGTRQVRHLVQYMFDLAIDSFRDAGQEHESLDLSQATVHWLRHTAISLDVTHRPQDHVRADVGHDNPSVTAMYIETDRMARHRSARSKSLMPDVGQSKEGQDDF
jgi:integrase